MAAPAAPAWSTRRDRARAAYAIKEKPEERANEYLLGPIKSEIARSCQQARLDVPPSRGIRWTNSERLESGRNARSRIVPIVFAGIADPVAAGYVESLARPGRNATGFTVFEYSIAGKWLELLKEIAPRLTRVAVLREPGISSAHPVWLPGQSHDTA